MSKTKHSILIVDDDVPLLENMADVFQAGGWVVYQASSIKTALELLAQNTIRVVLSDVRMPGAGGLELASNIRDIRAQKNNVSLFFMTGFSDYPDEVLLSLGAKGIFRKPFEVSECISKILKVIQ